MPKEKINKRIGGWERKKKIDRDKLQKEATHMKPLSSFFIAGKHPESIAAPQSNVEPCEELLTLSSPNDKTGDEAVCNASEIQHSTGIQETNAELVQGDSSHSTIQIMKFDADIDNH